MLLLQPNLRSTIGLLFLNKFVIMLLFLTWAVFSSRPFCRTACPLGAFYALFSKVRLIKLHLDEAKCTNCKACHHVCPMLDAISLEIGGIPLAVPDKGLSPASKP